MRAQFFHLDAWPRDACHPSYAARVDFAPLGPLITRHPMIPHPNHPAEQVKGKPRRSEGGGSAPGAGAGSGGAGGGGGGGGGRRIGRRTTIGAKSLGAQFRENLNNLVATVDKTHPHYVRTIKPNDDLKPGNFAYGRIAEQLRNAGVLEVVRVARAGFPVRLGIQEFIDRYGVLAPMVVETAYRNCAQVRGGGSPLLRIASRFSLLGLDQAAVLGIPRVLAVAQALSLRSVDRPRFGFGRSRKRSVANQPLLATRVASVLPLVRRAA